MQSVRNPSDQIKEFKEKIAFFTILSEDESRDLHSKTLCVYQKKVLGELEKIFFKETDLNKLVQALKNFLTKNWYFINYSGSIIGSYLSYTALPKQDLTILLCDLATFVKENTHDNQDKNFCALTILMPTISLESQSNDTVNYPDLSELDVKQVLKTYVLGRSGTYLIPVHQLIELQDMPAEKRPNIYYDYTKHSDELTFFKSG